jgi:hypothetical protein
MMIKRVTLLLATAIAASFIGAAPAHAWGSNCYNGGYYLPSDCGGQGGYPWTYYPQYYPPPPYGYGGGYGGGQSCFSFNGFFFNYYTCS